jgi:hypothetical protein
MSIRIEFAKSGSFDLRIHNDNGDDDDDDDLLLLFVGQRH